MITPLLAEAGSRYVCTSVWISAWNANTKSIFITELAVLSPNRKIAARFFHFFFKPSYIYKIYIYIWARSHRCLRKGKSVFHWAVLCVLINNAFRHCKEGICKRGETPPKSRCTTHTFFKDEVIWMCETKKKKPQKKTSSQVIYRDRIKPEEFLAPFPTQLHLKTLRRSVVGAACRSRITQDLTCTFNYLSNHHFWLAEIKDGGLWQMQIGRPKWVKSGYMK